MTRRPTPAQAAALERLQVVRQGWDGKNVICHRLVAGAAEMFRIAPDGKATQL